MLRRQGYPSQAQFKDVINTGRLWINVTNARYDLIFKPRIYVNPGRQFEDCVYFEVEKIIHPQELNQHRKTALQFYLGHETWVACVTCIPGRALALVLLVLIVADCVLALPALPTSVRR